MKNKKSSDDKDLFKVKLTKVQLTHLRDMLGIVLPPDTKTTVSEALATIENRRFDEMKLWEKVKKACVKADIPVENDAPDFVVSMESHPTLSVYKLSEDDDEDGECCGDDGCQAINKMFDTAAAKAADGVDDSEEEKDEG